MANQRWMFVLDGLAELPHGRTGRANACDRNRGSSSLSYALGHRSLVSACLCHGTSRHAEARNQGDRWTSVNADLSLPMMVGHCLHA